MDGSPEPPRPSDPTLRRLVDFYDPSIKGPDARNRTLDEILAWDDARLESQHDYIQTLFPLPEDSVFSFVAPVIDEETFRYWRRHDELKHNMLRAFERMLAFYGFEPKPASPRQQRRRLRQSEASAHRAGSTSFTIEEAAGSRAKLARWVRRLDHNHLRITRIIRSLRVLGLEEAAAAFYDALVRTHAKYGRIGATTLLFWERAARGPLHEAPDRGCVEWLEKYAVVADEEEEEGISEGED